MPDQAQKPAGQDSGSAERNAEFFAQERYGEQIAELDTYRFVREAIDREVAGTGRLLDVGNGGVFEYDTGRVESIVAVDLFLEDLPKSHFPANAVARNGSALELDDPDESYDAVLHAFLYHHLVGRRPGEMADNARRAIAEAHRVLKPGGRLIVPESCVPRWFYPVEWLLFRPLLVVAKTPLIGGHPATFQLTKDRLLDVIGEHFEIERFEKITTGRWVSQFGRNWPTALTPARPYLVTAVKR